MKARDVWGTSRVPKALWNALLLVMLSAVAVVGTDVARATDDPTRAFCEQAPTLDRIAVRHTLAALAHGAKPGTAYRPHKDAMTAYRPGPDVATDVVQAAADLRSAHAAILVSAFEPTTPAQFRVLSTRLFAADAALGRACGRS